MADLLERAGVNLTVKYDKDRFMEKVVKLLEIDPAAGELIFQEIVDKGIVTADKFIEFIHQFDDSTEKRSEVPRPEKEVNVSVISHESKKEEEIKKEQKKLVIFIINDLIFQKLSFSKF